MVYAGLGELLLGSVVTALIRTWKVFASKDMLDADFA